MTGTTGRERCPNCGGHGTERERSSKFSTDYRCHDCGHEWTVEHEVDRDPHPDYGLGRGWE